LAARELLRTPWLWAYRPVKIDERDGAHSGVATNPFARLTP
jgi:hypothetical protein